MPQKRCVAAGRPCVVSGSACPGCGAQDLDDRCELFMERTFGENVQFDVEDAVDKLLRLGIASEAGDGKLKHVALRQAVKAIGTTTDEIFGSTDLIEPASDSGAPQIRSSSDSN